jgi:large subunit ribosomal protein L23
MNREKLMKILLSPLMTEKTYGLGEQKVAFKVLRTANKAEIKHAVELLFDVKVDAVQTLNVKGKTRRFGRVQGRTQDWKKAYVHLHEGSKIDFGGSEA